MERYLHYSFSKYIVILFAAIGLILVPYITKSQEVWEEWEAETYQVKYRTDPNSPVHTQQYAWDDIVNVKWQKWDTKNLKWDDMNGSPPTNPPANQSNLAYIKISSGHDIRVKGALDYKNRLTLVICGKLSLGSFVFVPNTPEIVSFNVSSSGNFLNLHATYESILSVSEYGDPEPIVGFSVIPQNEGYDIFNSNTRIRALISSENFDNDIYTGTFDLEGLNFWRDDQGNENAFVNGKVYEILVFAENIEGIGYSQIYSYLFSSKSDTISYFKKEKNLSQEANIRDEVYTFNRLRVWICEDGVFQVDKLNAMNNPYFWVDGLFQVNELQLGNGYCIDGSGTVENDNGELPPINGQPWYNPCDEFFPIDLLSFESKVHPEYIELNWVTATELNNDFFTLERSSDLYSWEIVGYVQGAGTTSEVQNYNFRDYSPREGISYYRLKQTDFDGQFEYFGPLSVIYMPGADGLDFRVLRHPDQWTIFVPGEGAYYIELYDLTGRKLYSDMVVNNVTIPAPGQTVVVRVFQRPQS
jgi:hypothetical protein